MSLSAALLAELDRQDGPRFVRILTLEWSGVRIRVSDADVGYPYYAEGRVKSWNGTTSRPEPGRLGGYGSMSVEIFDGDDTFRPMLEEPKAGGGRATLELTFPDVGYANGTVVEFVGDIGEWSWSGESFCWTVEIKGLENRQNVEVGERVNRETFREARCGVDENAIVPIVFGDNVQRVPCYAIDRPGSASLAYPLNLCDDNLYLTFTAEERGFPAGVDVRLSVGVPGNVEHITGYFPALDSNRFIIKWRSSWIVAGRMNAIIARNGTRYLTIPLSIVPEGARIGGHTFVTYDYGCRQDIIAEVAVSGSSVIVNREPADQTYAVNGGERFAILDVGPSPFWDAGTPVVEESTWTYAVSHFPAVVNRVEGRSTVTIEGSPPFDFYREYNPAAYSVIADDRRWNPQMGRSASDPGITTVTVASPPTDQGFSDPMLYVSMNGILPRADWGVWVLATHPTLGDVPSDMVDKASLLPLAEGRPMRGYVDRAEKLHDLLNQIAYAYGGTFCYRNGQLTFAHLAAPPDETEVVYTVQPATTLNGSITRRTAPTDPATRIEGRFKHTGAAEATTVVVESLEAGAIFGKRTEAVDVWCFQDGIAVAEAIRNWLQYGLNRSLYVGFTMGVNGHKVGPGDVVFCNHPQLPFEYARVLSVVRTAASTINNQFETTEVEAVMFQRSFPVRAALPVEPCDEDAPLPPVPTETRNVV